MTETLRQADTNLIRSLVDGSLPIDVIDQRLQAYVDLDPDVLVPVTMQRFSAHPIRILMFPTSHELNTPTKIAAAKIGTEALYWTAVTQLLLHPNKLWANGYSALLLLPIILDRGQTHLIYADWPGPIEHMQEKHPHRLYNYYVRTINYGGDGDFFSDLRYGRVEQTYAREERQAIRITLEALGIQQSLADQVVQAREAVYSTSYTLHEKATRQLIKSGHISGRIAFILNQPNQSLKHSGDIAIALYKMNVGFKEIKKTVTTIAEFQKKYYFLKERMNLPMYQAVAQLARNLEEMYFKATGERISQKYPFSV